MKERQESFKRGFLVLILLGALSISSVSIITSAAVNIALKPYYVSDIDNVLYPPTSQYTVYDGLQGVGSFVLKEPTIIKAYFNWDGTTSKSISGIAWFSRDSAGLDVIGTSKKLTKIGDSILIFLDPGTYYINHLFSVRNSSEASFLRVGTVLLAENARSDENVYASSYSSPNRLNIGKPVRGFLSTIAPIDYYYFAIKSKSQVTINYNFEQTDNVSVSSGLCTIYDNLNQKIVSKNFSTRGSSSNQITQMLDKGTYYIALSGSTCATNLEVNSVSYDVDISRSAINWTNKSVTVRVLTEFEAEQILYVNKSISNVKIMDNSIWRTYLNNCFEVENSKFTVSKNGYYTVRVRDKDNYHVLKRIYIDNIDKTKPVIQGVANKKTYKKGTVVKFYDKTSSVKKATLNGIKIKTGKKITKVGKYSLKVYDYAGNSRAVIFYIK